MLQSGFTEYFKFGERWVHLIPDSLSFEEAALIEPLAVAVHNATRAGLKVGNKAAILGAGPIGLLLLQVARAMGASTLFITDTVDYRLNLAKKLGADYTVNAVKEDPVQKIKSLTDGLGVDVCFETVGLERTFDQALKVLKKGGMARIVGTYGKPNITFDVMQLIGGELRVSGTFGYCWDYPIAIDLAGRGCVNLKALISHIMPLDKVKEAFEMVSKKEANAVKVVIKI
jgi:threonine dehydrogenase-like Zn-dependent dehydrogenase